MIIPIYEYHYFQSITMIGDLEHFVHQDMCYLVYFDQLHSHAALNIASTFSTGTFCWMLCTWLKT